MQQPWIAAVAFLGVACLIALSMVGLSLLLRVRARNPVPTTGETYECGEEPDGVAWMRFHPRYYVIALIFVLFDVETVFLLPWAVVMREVGLAGFVTAGMFIFILTVGLIYEWKKGALEWD